MKKFLYLESLVLLSLLLVGGVAALAAPQEGGEGCSSADAPATAFTGESRLSDDEVERVAAHLLGEVLAGRTAFDPSEIAEATGVTVGEADAGVLREAVMAKLNATEAGRARLSGSRCQAYEACSLYGDLSGASGEILTMYEREKVEDGRTFDDFELPRFTARDLEGREVSSGDLLGQPLLLAFVAVHCRHSMDSLPILQELTETWGPEGLRVVAVAVNSGGVEDVNTWFPSFEPNYEVWVSAGDELGDAIGSHLVPTYLFVDADGRITEKLVGFKEGVEVTERVLARIAGETPSSPEVASR